MVLEISVKYLNAARIKPDNQRSLLMGKKSYKE